MPTLDLIGKKAVVHHHREAQYRLIHCDKMGPFQKRAAIARRDRGGRLSSSQVAIG